MNLINYLMLSIILIPLASAGVVLFLPGKRQRYALVVTSAFIGLLTMVALGIAYAHQEYTLVNINYIKIIGNLYFSLQAEPFGIVFAGLISVLWPMASLYTIHYMQAEAYYSRHPSKDDKYFYFFLLISISVTFGVAFAGNLLTTYLFYEILTFSTYPLVVCNKTSTDKEAGKVYLGLLLATSTLLFLPAIILVYIYTGSLTYQSGGLFFVTSPGASLAIMLMFMLGVAKSAIMPFHRWLPRAMVAPSPISAILHAVSVVKSGVFVLIKVVLYIFSTSYLSHCSNTLFHGNIFIILPAITIVLATFVNLYQSNFKVLLAYSTISQLSYIILCIFLLNKYAICATALYFVAHALAKMVLFLQAGAYAAIFKEYSINRLAGVGGKNKLPIITFLGTISTFSILGFPFTLGFVAKFYLIKAIIASGSLWLFTVLAFAMFCTSIYFCKAMYVFYFPPPVHNGVHSFIIDTNKSVLFMTVPMLIITTLNILLCFQYPFILTIINRIIL